MTGPWIAAFVALAALVLVLAVVVFGLLRRFSEALERVEALLLSGAVPEMGLQAGQQVPAFEVRTAAGGAVRLPMDVPVLSVLTLLEPGCAACEVLAAELAARGWPEASPPLVVVFPAEDPDSVTLAPAAAGVQVLYQTGRAASVAFSANVSPLAFAVDSAGSVIDSFIPSTVDSLIDFAGHARERHSVHVG